MAKVAPVLSEAQRQRVLRYLENFRNRIAPSRNQTTVRPLKRVQATGQAVCLAEIQVGGLVQLLSS